MTREEAIMYLKRADVSVGCKVKTKTAEAIEMAIEALQKEPCGDCVSRETVMHILDEVGGDFDSPREAVVPIDYIADMVAELPSVTPQPEVGRWIYDKNIDNWKCSECGETPKTMGYCGSVAFMAEHFKYCNHCGCKMQEVEE